MHKLKLVLAGVVLTAGCRSGLSDEASPHPADLATFYAWWGGMASTTLESDQAPTAALPTGVRRRAVSYLTLRHDATVPRPDSAVGPRWRALTLDESQGRRVVLWVPTDSLNRADLSGACGGARSWVGAEPFTAWTSIDLNPYCDETYGPDEIDVALYWLETDDHPWPMIEITTNGPACIPSELYRYDGGNRRYVQVREACAA